MAKGIRYATGLHIRCTVGLLSSASQASVFAQGRAAGRAYEPRRRTKSCRLSPEIIHQLASSLETHNVTTTHLSLDSALALCRHYVQNRISMWSLYTGFCVVNRFVENAASCQLLRIGDMHIHYNPYTHNQLSSAVKDLQCRPTV